MLFIVPFEPSHYHKNKHLLRNLDPTSWYFNNPLGPAYSIYYEDKYLGTVGFVFLYKGVALVWLITTIYVEDYPQDFIKACHEIFDFQVEVDEIWRVETRVPANFPKFITFIEHFGFTKEGLARQYGPNKEDFYIYAWVRKD